MERKLLLGAVLCERWVGVERLGMMRVVVEKVLKYGFDKLESDKEMGNVVVRVD
jgi:hypothetical protein